MTYQVPPKPAEPKPRYVRVTDPAEIAAINRNDLRAPIATTYFDSEGRITYWAEAHSLAQFRGHPVGFNV